MKVVIHIGVPKTGTSAIQSHLSTNRKWLLEQGIYVPRAGFQTGHGHGLLFSRHDTKNPPDNLRPWLPEQGALEALVQEIEQAVSLHAPDKVLLSWEGFALLDATLTRLVCQALAPHDLEVLCYVRNQHKLWKSQLSQSIKMGGSRAVQLLDYVDGAPIRDTAHLDFHGLLSGWSDALGDRGIIRTRLYSRSLLAGGDIVTDLLDALGVEMSQGFSLQTGDINESLNLASTAILALVEEVGIDRRQRHQLVRALVKASAGGVSPPGTGQKIEQPATEAGEDYFASNEALWHQFPPENASRQDFEKEMLQQSPRHDGAGDPTLALCREAMAALNDGELITWHGGMLRGHQLGDVARVHDGGWRRSEGKGVWSVGERSGIAFRLPQLSLDHGPDKLRLIFGGRYFGQNRMTRVCGHGLDQRIDLSHGAIDLPLSEDMLRQGVQLELIHDHPVSPQELGSGQSEDRLAYMLQVLYYELD